MKKEVREGYKMTEFGEIPEEWEVKKLEDVCEILDSKRIPLNEKQRLTMKGDIPYYGANSIVDYINNYLFDSTLILLAEDGGNFFEFKEKPIAFYVEGKCWVNNHAHVLEAKIAESSKWIFYNLVHRDLSNIVQGGTRAKLNQKDLRNIIVTFPKLEEQQKIASILSTVDEQIDNVDALIEKNKELKKGLMQTLLTKGIGHTKFKKTEVGEIPEEWEIKSLGELGEFKNGINKSKEDFGFGCKFVNIQDAYSKNVININSLGLINANENEKKIYQLEDGDIVLVRSSVKPEGVGYPILFRKYNDDIVVYCGFMIRYRYDIDKINPMFMLYNLRSYKVRQKVLSLSTVSANTNINQESYKEINIVLPTVEEQEKIASILSEVDNKIEEYRDKKERLEEIKKGLMQQLLTGKIRVN